MKKQSLAILAISVAMLVAPAAVVLGDSFSNQIIIAVQDTSGGTTFVRTMPVAGGTFKGQLDYEISNVPLGDTMIENLKVSYQADPMVTFSYTMRAGANDATFTIWSAGLNFDPIADPVAYASSSVTVTDRNQNGAMLTGLLGGGTAYEGRFSNDPADPLVSPWAGLLTSSVVAGVGGTGTASDPASPGWAPVGHMVSSMSAQLSFSLTARDSASGTSVFEVVPEPTTMGLLALGCLGLLRRRR